MYATHPTDALYLARERARRLAADARGLRRATSRDCPLVALLRRLLERRNTTDLAHSAT